MAQVSSDDILIALVNALNRATDAEAALTQILEQQAEEPDAKES